MNPIPIIVTVNGEARTLAAGQSLADLVQALGQAPAALATAVNGEFVAREVRGARALHDGDAVFTFQAITGG